MISIIIRINFIISSIFFFIKVIFHIMLLYQEQWWIKQIIAETQGLPLPLLLHPLNLPVLGAMFGIVSLVLFVVSQSHDKENNVKKIYILMPFVYVFIWGIIFFIGWEA